MGLTSKVFGSSSNKKVDVLTKEQKAYMNSVLGGVTAGAGQNIDTLQGYADEGYNPYDDVLGTQLVGNMKRDIDKSRNDYISALKGGPMNRFSMAMGKATGDAYDSAQKQQTELDYKDLLTKAGFGQQAYSNQNQAINNLFSLGNSMLGTKAFDNQPQMNRGILDYVNQGASSVTNVANAATALGKTASSFGGDPTAAAGTPTTKRPQG